jgi:Kef-type K+ transport system membrane component KefB
VPIVIFLIQAFVILFLPLLAWWPVRRFTPMVLLQIGCGIALGPTLLGRLEPTWQAALFPPASLGALSGLSSFAVMCVAFVAGLEVDPRELRHQAREIVCIGLASALVPAIIGGLFSFLALGFWPGLVGDQESVPLFVGAGAICFGVTALPVLIAILHETALLNTRLGKVALALAAMNDIILWAALSVLMLFVQGGRGPGLPWWTKALMVVALLLVLAVARRLIDRRHAALSDRPMSTGQLTIALVGMLLCATITEAAGLHALIGSFIAGVMMPHRMREKIHALVGPFSNVAMLPFFFVSAGLSINAATPFEWSFFAATVAVGSGAKVASTALAALAFRWHWREALRLGALMQSRGLMEVVVLRLLYEAGVISNACMSALLLMALFTTALAMPVLRWLRPSPAQSRMADNSPLSA